MKKDIQYQVTIGISKTTSLTETKPDTLGEVKPKHKKKNRACVGKKIVKE